MNGRSELRLRTRPHCHPDRKDETVVEVWRDGKVVATIYGSREGIHVVSERYEERPNVPFRFHLESGADQIPSFVLPLLARDEVCPWCLGAGQFPLGECPVCQEGK